MGACKATLLLLLGDAPVTIINKGVGNGLRETVNFTFYPAAAGESSGKAL